MPELLQHWLCDVGFVDHGEGFVYVRMHDKTDPSSPAEYAEIYLSCFTDEQRRSLSEGVEFHWRVYADGRNEFEVVVVPPLTPEEEAECERRAVELAEALFGRLEPIAVETEGEG